jgi:hypothetical protein
MQGDEKKKKRGHLEKMMVTIVVSSFGIEKAA